MPKSRSKNVRNAGLVFTQDSMPGYSRKKAGRGFSYLLPQGTTLRDKAERRRIVSLGVPPAYESVWICMKPNGHLQATGLDERGRKQYRYHPLWQQYSSDRKFELLPGFAKALPAIRRRVAAALDGEGVERKRVVAGIVALLDRTGFRIGNHRYAKENRSFGLVSLLSRHLKESGHGWEIRFRGKSGKPHRAEIRDALIEALIDELHDLPGQYLFCHRQGGRWRPINSGDVNSWLKKVSGKDYTAKQFRTWRATLLCARELGRLGPPATEAEARHAEIAAIRKTADELNHTPAVCRKYYIHPAIFESYRCGKLHSRMHARAPKLRRSDGSAGLLADERRVLSLIENHRPARRSRNFGVG